MRILALAIFTIAAASAAPSAHAQTYDPNFPVCMHVHRLGANYYDCRFATIPQCQATASGQAAYCLVNPYYAGGPGSPGGRDRRYRSGY